MKRSFLLALLLSALLHVMVLAAPGWYVGNMLADEAPPPLEARLVSPPPKPKPVPKPIRHKAVHEAVREVEPPPSVDNVKSVEPEKLATADEPKPTEPPEPSTPPVAAESAPPEQEAVPEAATQAGPAAAPEIAPPLPKSGRIRYSIARGDGGFVVGQSVHEWHHDGKRYTLNATMETTGIAAIFKPVKVTQTSTGGFLQGELKPDSFRFDRGDNDVATAEFNWQTQQVTLGNGQVVSISEGAEDFLSMFYQLMQAAQRGEGFIMAVATGRKVERYAFEWLGEEELALRPGNFHAWHVRVRAESGGKDTTEIWLGKEVLGLPIKIRFTDRKGNVSEQVAEEIDYEGK